MSARSLFEPVIDGGIRNPNWFEGRLLTAQSMRERDEAERQRERLLGRALGPGVVEGLFVSPGPADANGIRKTLSITRGVAINAAGDTLMLPQDLSVDVVPAASAAAADATLFARCKVPPPIASIPSGFGLYVLVMSPASAPRERAPMSGLGQEGVVTGCGAAFAVEGVQFRLEALAPASISGIGAAERDELDMLIANSADANSRSLLRNLAANYCLGTVALARFPIDPFNQSGTSQEGVTLDAIDDLRNLQRIGKCDVPLAAVLWNIAGASFVDPWSVRRRVTPVATNHDSPQLAAAGAGELGRARFLQFQDHVREVGTGPLATGDVRAAFRYLPAAGMLPLATTPGGVGFDRVTFFGRCATRRPAFLEGARLPALLELSFRHPPIVLPRASDSARSGLIWLYFIVENAAAIDGVAAGSPGRGVLAFASGAIPYAANATFDAARWNYANYSLR